jgi:hypothetical protein
MPPRRSDFQLDLGRPGCYDETHDRYPGARSNMRTWRAGSAATTNQVGALPDDLAADDDGVYLAGP